MSKESEKVLDIIFLHQDLCAELSPPEGQESFTRAELMAWNRIMIRLMAAKGYLDFKKIPENYFFPF